jgi:hypothetical protein
MWISLSVLCSCCETDPLSGIQNNHHTEKDQENQEEQEEEEKLHFSRRCLRN